LAGGVAHDFNNILMGIQGNVSLLLFDMRETDASWPKLKTMEKYIQQGANLSRQILSFARGVRHETKPVDINEVVQKTIDLLQRTHKEISIEIDCQKDVYPVIADQTQIEQALMNLYVNACQAMTTGGVLKIGTKNVYPGESNVKSVGRRENKFVQITVMDTGIGMDKNTRERIFDPFFTTKEMGKGTGLGLASVYSIIKNHGGTIEVYSEKGKGSRFEILLPSTDSPARREFPSMEEIVKGTGTILLVDDEEMILEIGGEILKKIGYRVLQANGGQKALDLYRRHRDEIDLVILDMIMPDMDGKQVYDRLKEINDEVKVLISSGFSVEGQLENVLGKPSRGFIQKPFRIEELSRKIREILN
jgi:CheY-like chemotaxis protein